MLVGIHIMVKLILVDDEQLFLNSLARYITAHMPDFEICGCFHNGKDALAYMQTHKVDIMITTSICRRWMGWHLCVRRIYIFQTVPP